jgi:hypothetical protein
MSHFTVLVITPNGTEQEAEALLAPYCEHTEVEPYQTQCWCVGINARKSVREAVTLEMPIEKARDEFLAREDVCNLIEESKKAGNYGFSEEVDRLWDERFDKPFELREKELLAARPDRDAADPTCDECKGTGIETTTYNPRSKWDWYELGGRWWDLLAVFQGEPVSKFLEAKGEDDQPFRTFAIITPDGQWLEAGKLLCFAVVAEEKDPREWEACYNETLDKYRDHRALFYDCHI